VSRRSGGRLVVVAVVVHLLLAAVVGYAWWRLTPQLTYTVVDGQAFVTDELGYGTIFDSDGLFTLLGAGAGLVAGAVLLGRGFRGVAVPVVLALGGLAGSGLASWIGVTLGPGRLVDLVAGTGEGQVVPGPELNAEAAVLAWPIVAVGVVFVVTAFSEPERTRRRPRPGSAQ
jgi:hypothetical protein